MSKYKTSFLPVLKLTLRNLFLLPFLETQTAGAETLTTPAILPTRPKGGLPPIRDVGTMHLDICPKDVQIRNVDFPRISTHGTKETLIPKFIYLSEEGLPLD